MDLLSTLLPMQPKLLSFPVTWTHCWLIVTLLFFLAKFFPSWSVTTIYRCMGSFLPRFGAWCSLCCLGVFGPTVVISPGFLCLWNQLNLMYQPLHSVLYHLQTCWEGTLSHHSGHYWPHHFLVFFVTRLPTSFSPELLLSIVFPLSFFICRILHKSWRIHLQVHLAFLTP